MEIDNLPIELTKNREMIEGNFIFCLYKNPDLFPDYPIRANDDLYLDDSKFYYALGMELYKLGYRSFDDATIQQYISNKDIIKNGYERRGGYRTIQEITRVLNEDNIDSYYDDLTKWNKLITLHQYGFNVMSNIDNFIKMSNDEVDQYYDYIFNDVMVQKTSDIQMEDLEVDDQFIQDNIEGLSMGLRYNKYCHILDYLTMGLPKGDITAVASYTNGGKTSFIINNMVIPVAESGIKTCIISNEQQIQVYKTLLLVYVLTEELDYYSLTRKKIKAGKYTDEDLDAIKKAQNVIREKYTPYIKFVKLFDYNMGKVAKIIKKLSRQGYEMFAYDTMKLDTDMSSSEWVAFLKDSKILFQAVSKCNVACVVSLQLALHTEGTRFLGYRCLANGKQISEVMSEIIMFRDLWEDEFNGEKFDVETYRHERDENGKYSKNKKLINLDKDKNYKIFFHVKTRSDEANQCLLYEFNGRYNKWYEKGFCKPQHVRT